MSDYPNSVPEPPQSLTDAVQQTLAHYQQNAEGFREGTRDHDVSQNIDALLRHIDAQAPLQLLDLGCGPGRDLRTFTRMGHEAVGLETWRAFMLKAGFVELEHYYRPPGLPREQQPWLASVWRKPVQVRRS